MAVRRAILAALLLAGASIAAAAEQGAAIDPATGRTVDDLPIAPKATQFVTPDYPPSAFVSGLEGFARLAFTITPEGRVEDVAIVAESLERQGFGSFAAIALDHSIFPSGVAGRYRVKINFKLPPGTPLATTPPPPLADATPGRQPPVYPGRAERAGVGGDVVLDVRIAADGTLAAVSIFDETPPGFEFGAAAIKAVKSWEFAKGALGDYRLTIRFRVE